MQTFGNATENCGNPHNIVWGFARGTHQTHCGSGLHTCVCLFLCVYSLTDHHDVQFCDHVHNLDQLHLHDPQQSPRLGQERGVSPVFNKTFRRGFELQNNKPAVACVRPGTHSQGSTRSSLSLRSWRGASAWGSSLSCGTPGTGWISASSWWREYLRGRDLPMKGCILYFTVYCSSWTCNESLGTLLSELGKAEWVACVSRL